jgi:hypothetical protein
MFTLRSLAIVLTGAGVFAGLPLTNAQACDDDRFPCPVVSEAAPQETAAPAQPRKKANHPARPDKKAQAKVERAASRATVQAEAPRAATRTKASKPAVQEPSISQDAAEAAPAMVPEPPADQALKKESRNEGLVAAAGTVWPALPNAEGAGAEAATASGPAQAAPANAVPANAMQVTGAKVHELDHAAAASHTGMSSWMIYLLLVLGAALAAASAIWFLFQMMFMYARRTAGQHMHKQFREMRQ